jgi:tight adherence protein B
MFEAISTALGTTATIWLTGGLAFLSVSLFMYAIWGIETNTSGISRLNIATGKDKNSKQSVGDRRKEIQDQLRKQEEQQRKNNKASLEMMLVRARMEISAFKLRVICGGIGLGVISVLTMQGVPLVFALAVLPLFVFIVPVKVAKFRVGRLQKRFIAFFPDAIDVMVRGVRTGLPVGEGMRLVAREMPEPVATEFKLLTDATAVGVTLEDALTRMFNRMPLPEVNFFNIVLAIQKQTGGNLAEALGNLSNTLRERKKLKLKIKALSSEAKASAMIIGSLPFVLACVLFAVAPDYLGLLFNTDMGNMMLAGGAFWMSIGIFTMYSMIDIEI